MKEYRTFVVVVLGIGALAYCALHGVHGEDLQAVKWGLLGLAATAAGRSVGRAAAGGGGLRGIGAALLTEAKPDGAPPAPVVGGAP